MQIDARSISIIRSDASGRDNFIPASKMRETIEDALGESTGGHVSTEPLTPPGWVVTCEQPTPSRVGSIDSSRGISCSGCSVSSRLHKEKLKSLSGFYFCNLFYFPFQIKCVV
jgi:hypothetical protein